MWDNNDVIKKKFYRDFTEKEADLLDELQVIVSHSYPFVPPYVVKRMIERGIIADDIDLFDENGDFIYDNYPILNDDPGYQNVINTLSEGIAYEFSNEGRLNPILPYRVVWAAEMDDGYVYFVKTSVPPMRGGVRVVDVWRKSGSIPVAPPRRYRQVFAAGTHWDIGPALRKILDIAIAEANK